MLVASMACQAVIECISVGIVSGLSIAMSQVKVHVSLLP